MSPLPPPSRHLSLSSSHVADYDLWSFEHRLTRSFGMQKADAPKTAYKAEEEKAKK